MAAFETYDRYLMGFALALTGKTLEFASFKSGERLLTGKDLAAFTLGVADAKCRQQPLSKAEMTEIVSRLVAD